MFYEVTVEAAGYLEGETFGEAQLLERATETDVLAIVDSVSVRVDDEKGMIALVLKFESVDAVVALGEGVEAWGLAWAEAFGEDFAPPRIMAVRVLEAVPVEVSA